MTTLPLQALTERLEKELYRLHYTEASVMQYRRMWRRIATFLEHEGLDHFTEEAGMRFLNEQYNFFALEKAGELTQSINVFVSALKSASILSAQSLPILSPDQLHRRKLWRGKINPQSWQRTGNSK